MSRFGKTILKWKEPKIISKIIDKNLSLMNRIWRNHSVPFFSGTILFFILLLLESEIPNTFLQLLFGLLLSTLMGMVFVIIYGLLGLTSPRIHIREKCIERKYVEDVKRYQYSEITCYDFFDDVTNGEPIKLLLLRHKNDEIVFLELSQGVSQSEIENALISRVEKSKINFNIQEIITNSK